MPIQFDDIEEHAPSFDSIEEGVAPSFDSIQAAPSHSDADLLEPLVPPMAQKPELHPMEPGVQQDWGPIDWAISGLGWVGDKVRPVLDKAYDWNRQTPLNPIHGTAALDATEMLSRAGMSSVLGPKVMETQPDANKLRAINTLEDTLGSAGTTAALTGANMVAQAPQMLMGLGWAKRGATAAEAMQLEGKVLPKLAKLGAEAAGSAAEGAVVGTGMAAVHGEKDPLSAAPGGALFGGGMHVLGGGAPLLAKELQKIQPTSKGAAFLRRAGNIMEADVGNALTKGYRRVGAVVGDALDMMADEVGLGRTDAPPGEPKFLKGPSLVISHETIPGGNGESLLSTKAVNKRGEQIGEAVFRNVDGKLVAEVLRVNPEYQRQGVASQMYTSVEQKTGLKVKPAGFQSKEGAAFWKGSKNKFGAAEEAPSVQALTAGGSTGDLSSFDEPKGPTAEDRMRLAVDTIPHGEDAPGVKVRPGDLKPSFITLHADPEGGLTATVNELHANGERKYYDVPIRTLDDAARVGKLASDNKLSRSVANDARDLVVNLAPEMLERLYMGDRPLAIPESSLKGTNPGRKRANFPDLEKPLNAKTKDASVMVDDSGHVKLEPLENHVVDVSAMPEHGDAVMILGRGGQRNPGVYRGIDPVTGKAVVQRGFNSDDLGSILEVAPEQVLKADPHGSDDFVPAGPEIPGAGQPPRAPKAGEDAFLPNPNGGYLEVKVLGKGQKSGTMSVTLGPDQRPVDVDATKLESRLPPGVASFDDIVPKAQEPVLFAPDAADAAEVQAVKRVYDSVTSKGPGLFEKMATQLLGGQARAGKVMAFLHLRNQGSQALLRAGAEVTARVEKFLPKGEARRAFNKDLGSVFEGRMSWEDFQKKNPSANEVLRELTQNLDAERTKMDKRIADLGGIPDKLILERAEGLIDPYLARTYMLHLMPPGEWARYVRGTEAFDGAVSFLNDELKKSGLWVGPERVSAELESMLKAPNIVEAVKSSGLKETSLGKHLLARKELPGPLRKVMGEIEAGSIRMGVTIGSQRAIVAKLELFQDIAADQNLSSIGRRVDMYPEPIPDVPRLYGKLAGRYVKPEIYSELIALPNQIRNTYTVANKVAGWIKGNQLAGFGPWWTSLKGNIQAGILSGGASFLRPDQMGRSMHQAAKAMHDFNVDPTGRTGDGYLVLEAKKAGADWASQGEVHFSAESKKFVRKLYEELGASPQDGFSAVDVSKKLFGAHGKVNELFAHNLDIQDRWFRLSSYLTLRRKNLAAGMEPAQAAIEAAHRVARYFPNPGNVGPAVQKARNAVAIAGPYITAKAEDLRGRASMMQDLIPGSPAHDPGLKWRLLGHLALFGGATKMLHHLSGITDEEVELAQRSISKNTKAYKPALIPLAWRDAEGRVQMIDASPGVLELELLAGHPDDPWYKRMAFNLATFPVSGSPMEDVAAKVAEKAGLKRPIEQRPLMEGESDLETGVDTAMRMGLAPRYISTVRDVGRKTGLIGQTGKYEEKLTPGQGAAKALGVNIIPAGPKSSQGVDMSSIYEQVEMMKQLKRAMRSTRDPALKKQIVEAVKDRIRFLTQERQDKDALEEAVKLQQFLNNQ